MLPALKVVKARKPRELIAAAAVAPPSTIEKLAHKYYRVVSLIAPDAFFAISEFYEDFTPVENEEACVALREFTLATCPRFAASRAASFCPQ